MCILFKEREDFCRGEDKGCKHTRNILVPHKVEVDELPVASTEEARAAHITDKTTPYSYLFKKASC